MGSQQITLLNEIHFDQIPRSFLQTHTVGDLFAGIGGFHLAFKNLGVKTAYAVEIDKFARETYALNHLQDDNFPFFEDITTLDATELPSHTILCAGFPCQPFSQAGQKKGLGDSRGTLFYEIVRIIEAKIPKAFILENVRGLTTHDDGKTFKIIKSILEDELGYQVWYKVIHAKDVGLPQLRPRLFIVGALNPHVNFTFPSPTEELQFTMSDVLGGQCDRAVGYTVRVGGRGSGIDDRRNWDAYNVDGNVSVLTAHQAKRMQGFPKQFRFPVSKTQAMKQVGNSVAVDVVEAIAKNLFTALYLAEHEGNYGE